MDIPVIFEDGAMLAVNKPPGIVVNRAQSVQGETVQEWAEERLGVKGSALSDDFTGRAGIVHRIDKETSGILLIAKTPEAFAELQRQFKERIVHKTYLAVVHGEVKPAEGEIRAPVGRLPWNRERFGIVPGGKEAITKYKVKNNFLIKKDKYSYLELYPESGRTHQIRVHLKYINHPILGDYLYAGRKTSRDDRTWVPRVMLHAWKLTCIHPVTREPLSVEAIVPDDMQALVNLV